ncbi:unnamed protein product [Bemisia tabaci]|uniref:Uncharacterized protein n=1 Tax=Bemisia tabaci TaxID=7038 RepID=A0A9P0F5E5_BEMTA|nr:unnamed protein product [Bemisia tabaci]
MSNHVLKIGIDGGQGFLKVCLSVQSPGKNSVDVTSVRQTYEQEVLAKQFLDSGVKKIFILAITPHTQENSKNVAMMWSRLEINSLDPFIATDSKLANLLVGIMFHSSCFPCSWCEAEKSALHLLGPHRTVGNIMQNYLKFVESGENYKEAKKFENCIHPTVFSTEDKLILGIVLPPELHLSLGVVNTVYDHMLKHNEADALKRASLCNVKRDMTHGSPEFNGNSCRILLKKVDSLMRDSLACLPFVEVLQNFKLVVDACFSTTLHANYKNAIQNFKESYLALELPVTPEVHTVYLSCRRFL